MEWMEVLTEFQRSATSLIMDREVALNSLKVFCFTFLMVISSGLGIFQLVPNLASNEHV